LNLPGSGNTYIGTNTDGGTVFNATAIGQAAFAGQSNSIILGSINGVNGASVDTSVGIGTTTPNDRLEVNGIIRVSTLGPAGSTAICRNASNQISTCSSSLRYKTNINPFTPGLNLVKQLQPITFDWKANGMHDLGFGAEDVAKVEPLLTTLNDTGTIEGVKYDRISAVLVNAIKEQQAQIEIQKQQIEELRHQLSALSARVDRRPKKHR
jgi:hypothetical protein